MGEWQRGELEGLDIAYVAGLWQNKDGNEPVGSDLERWQAELNFTADVGVLDYAQQVFQHYANANPGPSYTNAVTVIIDRRGVIRDVKGTYDTDEAGTLALLQQLAAE